jgi:hypothetical protein
MDFNGIVLSSNANTKTFELPRLRAFFRHLEKLSDVLRVYSNVRAMPNHFLAVEPAVATHSLALLDFPQP